MDGFCDGFEKRLKNLKAGESIFIPGGWGGYPDQGPGKPEIAGHAMMYQVSKAVDGTYSIRIYNSGAGLTYHQASNVPGKHNPAVEWAELSEDKATNPILWQKILEAIVVPNVFRVTTERPKVYGPDDIYLEFQKHLKTKPRAVVELAALKDQRAGTCSRKASDMIGRAKLPAIDFKRLRIEEKVAGLGLLAHLIKKGELSISDQKIARELYIKTLPKVWIALAKYHQEFEPDSLSSTAYLIATLKSLEKEEWKDLLAAAARPELVDKLAAAKISSETMQDIHKNTKILAAQEIPLLHLVAAVVSPDTENLTPLQQFMSSLDSCLKQLNVEHTDPIDLLSQLQSEVYEQLPLPVGDGEAFWKQAGELKKEELEALLKNLQIAAAMCHKASHQLGQMLPQPILNAWKTYAAVTYMLRNRPEISEIVRKAPVSWAHFNAVYDHPLFSQFAGNFAEEAGAIRDFFEHDSAKGDKLVGDDPSEVESVPLFDYSWKIISVMKRDKIPEISCPENYIGVEDKHYSRNKGYAEPKEGGEFYLCMSAWSQMAQFAEQAIWENFDPKNARSIEVKKYQPLSTQFIQDGAFIENRTLSGPADLNLQRSLWQPSKQTEPFLKRLWSKEILEQSEVIKELGKQRKQSEEQSYHMDMISSSLPSLKLHLLLSYFEEHPSKLLEKDLLDYFMAHLHAGRFLTDTLEREPVFLDRLMRFFDRLAEEDSQKPRNDPSLQRILQVLYTICKVHQAIPDHQACSDLVEKMRKLLAKMPLTDPEKISQRARYMLASYSLAPPSTLRIDDYFKYLFENKQEGIKGGFEAFIALEASRFHSTVLPEIIKTIQEEKSRHKLLSSILQPAEEELLSRPFGQVTAAQELMTQSKLIAEWEKWNKDFQELGKQKSAREYELGNIREKLIKKGDLPNEEAPLDLDKLKEDDRWYLDTLTEKIETIEKTLPTIQEKIDSANQLTLLLGKLPEKWMLVGNILLIKEKNAIIEIDLALGRIYRNGLTVNKGCLPPSIQQSGKYAAFGKGLQAPALQEGSSFVIQKKGFEHVTFKSNVNQDVTLKLEKGTYTLLDLSAMSELKLPECFKNKPLSGWVDVSSSSAEIVLCLHDAEGRPMPSFEVNNDGSIRMYGHPEYHLFRRVPEGVLKTFQGMGVNPNNAFCWSDHKGNVRRLDLSLKDLDSHPLSFEKTSDGWVFAGNPNLRVCENQYVPELGIDDYHLVLENQEGQKIVQIPRDTFEKFYIASEGKKGRDSVTEFPAVYTFQWTPQGLQSIEPGAKLLLMYRHIKNRNYQQALELLKSGVTPVGKPFSEEELDFLKMIFGWSYEHKEHHAPANALRIALYYRVWNHLKRLETRFPGDEDVIRKFLSSYYQGVSPSEKLTLEALLTPDEELELLQKYGDLQNTHMMQRVIELKELISLPQNPLTLKADRQPGLIPHAGQSKKFDWEHFFNYSDNKELFTDKGGDFVGEQWLSLDRDYGSYFNLRQCYEALLRPNLENQKLLEKIQTLAEKFPYSDSAACILELIKKVKEGVVLPALPPLEADSSGFFAKLKALFVNEKQKENACKELFEIKKSLKDNPSTELPLEFGNHFMQAIALIEKNIQEMETINNALSEIEKGCRLEYDEEFNLVLKGLIEKVQKYREKNPKADNFKYRYDGGNQSHEGLDIGSSAYIDVIELVFKGLDSAKPVEDLAKEIAASKILKDDWTYPRSREEAVKKKFEEKSKDLKLSSEGLNNQLFELIGFRPSFQSSDSASETTQKLIAMRQMLLDISQLMMPVDFHQVFAPLLRYQDLVLQNAGIQSRQGLDYDVALKMPREMINALPMMGIKHDYSKPKPVQEMLNLLSGAFQKLEESIKQGTMQKFLADDASGKFLAVCFPLLKESKAEFEMISQAKKVIADIEKTLNQVKEWEGFVTEHKEYSQQAEANRIMKEWEGLEQPAKRGCYDAMRAEKELEKAEYAPFQKLVDKQWLFPVETYVNDALLVDEEMWNGMTDEEKKSLEPILKGLEEYRLSQKNEKSYSVNSNHVKDLQSKTASELSRLTKKNEHLEKSILDLANTLPVNTTQSLIQALREQGRHKHILNLKDCIYHALQDDMGVWKANTNLNDEQINELQAKVVAYLTVSTEIHHLQRGSKLLARAMKSPDVELLQEIGAWTLSERSYSLNEDCIHHLVFEHYADMRMRKGQKELIDQLSGLEIGPKAKGKVVQLIMGAGKSKVIGPILAIKAADGYHLSTFCFTTGLYGTGIADFSQTAMQRFGRISDTLQFSRADCTTEKLHRLVIHIQHAINGRKVLLHRPKDLLSMRMMIDERDELIHQFNQEMIATIDKWIQKSGTTQREAVIDYVLKGKEFEFKENMAEIKGFRQVWTEKEKLIFDYQVQITVLENILNLLNHRQDAQFDEWDSIADPKNQVSFPIGDPVEASPEGVDKACELYFQLLPKYEPQLRIENNAQTLVKEETIEQVRNGLAKNVWGLYRELLHSMKEDAFISFLKNEDSAPAHEVYETLKTMSLSESAIDRKLSEEIAFYKYALNGGLQTAWQADGNVSYGRSKIDLGQELAIPYEDNDVPKEGTRFRAVWETALKSCQYYRQYWNKPDQTVKLLSYFLNKDALEGENHRYFDDLKALFGPIEQIDVNSDRLKGYMKTMRNALKSQDPNHEPALRLIRNYMQNVVFAHQLRKDRVQITANPFDLVHIPGSSKGFSGTWAFPGAWSDKMKAKPSPLTDAMTIDALTEEENLPCLFLDSNKSFVDQLVQNPVTAIIDAAPLFKGVNNARLARQLLEGCPSKKAVIYYHDDGKGVSTLALLKKDGKEPLFLPDSSKETLEKALGDIFFEDVLTLYDRAHNVGSDIFQAKGAVAYVSIGDQLTKDRLLQAVMRMRMLIARGHHVRPVMTSEVAELIGKALRKDSSKLDSRDVLRYAKLVQDEKERAANPFALRDEIRYHVKAAVRLAKVQSSNFEERLKIHEQYRGHLLQIQDQTLFEEYGSIDVEEKTVDILTNEMNSAIKVLEEIGGNGDLVKQLKARLDFALKNIPLPQKLKTSSNLSDATIEIEQSTDKDQQKDLDQLKDINLDYEGPAKTPTIQKQWPTDVEGKDLFQTIVYGGAREEIPALYPLNDCHPSFTKVFDGSISASENWVKTFNDKENSLLTQDGRHIHHLLVVQEGNMKPKMVLLTSEESDQWIKLLIKKKESKSTERKIWLVEPGGELIQGSGTPWKEEAFSKELVPLLFLKGDVMKLASDKTFPLLEDWAKSHPNKSQLRPLLESILNLQEENFAYYLNNKKLAKAIS